MYSSVKGENNSTWILQATLFSWWHHPRECLSTSRAYIKKTLQWTKNASWIDRLTISPNSSTQQLGISKKKSATRRSISESISHFCVSAPWELRGGNLAMGRKPQWGNLSWHLTDPHRHRPSFFIAFLVLETCSANLFGLGVKGGHWRFCLFIQKSLERVTNVWTIRSIPQSQQNDTSRSVTPWKSLANWCPKWCLCRLCRELQVNKNDHG